MREQLRAEVCIAPYWDWVPTSEPRKLQKEENINLFN